MQLIKGDLEVALGGNCGFKGTAQANNKGAANNATGCCDPLTSQQCTHACTTKPRKLLPV
jgi:hypothetical protein